jgi:hypothetical protein
MSPSSPLVRVERGESSSMATLIVVKREASGTLHHLQAELAHTLGHGHDVEISGGKRREAEAVPLFLDDPPGRVRRERSDLRIPERRLAERRRRVPDTWRALGFVVVQRDCPAGV